MPDFQDADTLADYANTFSILKDHGLNKLLDLLESRASQRIRTFTNVSSHTELCQLKGEIEAYLSVREAVETVIAGHLEALEDEQNGR